MPSLRHCYSNITRIFKSLGAVSVDTRVARGSDLGLSGLGAYVAMKHDYFIEDLGQAAGWFKPHRYRYSCLRCAWSFVVEDGRGKVTAFRLDQRRRRIKVGAFATRILAMRALAKPTEAVCQD